MGDGRTGWAGLGCWEKKYHKKANQPGLLLSFLVLFWGA